MAWHYSQTASLLILTPLVALFALGLDLYIPIVPELSIVFDSSPEQMQLSLSWYMIMCGVGQIITGPLTDRYGRRPVALISLAIFIIGSLLGAYANSIMQLLLARMTQACGASGTFLCAYASVRDFSKSSHQSAKIYSLINVCIAQAPIFGPSIGAYLDKLFDWHAIFICLAIVGLLTLISTYQLYPETLPEHRSPNWHQLKKDYHFVLVQKEFMPYTLAASAGMASFFMFFSQSPYIIIDILGYSQQQFALMFGSIGACFLLSSLTTAHLCKSWGIHTCVEVGCSAMTGGGILLILSDYLFGTTAIGFLCPIALTISGAAFTIGAGMSGSMRPFGKLAGTAFAAIGFFKFLCSALLGLLLMQLKITPSILGLIIAMISSISQISCFCDRTYLLQTKHPSIHSEYD